MHRAKSQWKQFVKPVATWVLLAFLFSIAYTQSPLFTSNQNQYFLHGLARAGFGNLQNDWLTNTLDPTPLFSLVTEWSYRIFKIPAIFYIIYTIFMGVYLYSLLMIGDAVFKLRRSRLLTLLYLAILIIMHSAVIRLALSRLLGTQWAYVLEAGVAGQRLLGPVFQPSTFGVLLLLSVALFLRQKPLAAILCATLAASFHPTYLLSAGVLTLSYLIVLWIEKTPPKRILGLGAVALLTVTPILIYVYASFGVVRPDISARAQAILVNFRIPHHAIPARWFGADVVFQLGWIATGLYLARRSRLLVITGISALVALVLTLTQIATGSNTLALLFPWRISTYLVPISTALVLGCLLDWTDRRYPQLMQAHRKWLTGIAATGVLLAMIAGIYRSVLDFQRRATAVERPVLEFVSRQVTAQDVYLIPIQMQDFRLATGAAAYIEFKSIPYRDEDVIQWRRRVLLANQFYNRKDCNALKKIQMQGVTHVVIPADRSNFVCTGWQQLYQDEKYLVYRLP